MTISSLWKKFRSLKYRHAFVEAQLKRGVPTQIRAIRLKRGWTQGNSLKGPAWSRARFHESRTQIMASYHSKQF